MLWKQVIGSGEWPAELLPLWPLQYQPVIETPTLVIVGMNPAYAERDVRKCGERPITDTEVLLDPNGRAKLCTDTEFAKAPYFGPFGDFTKGTQLPGSVHLDMFAVRHTDQNDVKCALGLDAEWTQFALRQYEIFLGLLKEIDPPLIVVPNAYVSQKLHGNRELGAGDMSPDDGCHYIGLNGRKVPIFFSGMLTGQRAMDRYSRERLTHQVRAMISRLGY